MGFEASTGLLGELADTASDRLDLSPVRKRQCDILLCLAPEPLLGLLTILS